MQIYKRFSVTSGSFILHCLGEYEVSLTQRRPIERSYTCIHLPY